MTPKPYGRLPCLGGLHFANSQWQSSSKNGSFSYTAGLLAPTPWALKILPKHCRTLLYGGVAMNPRSHLRLVYEANPLAFLAEQARPNPNPAEIISCTQMGVWLTVPAI